MGKAPAFQLYVRDWLGDPALQSCASSTRGIWINALCCMWDEPERGKLVRPRESLALLLRATAAEMEVFWADLEAYKFADVTFGPKNVTIINRRMFREHNVREGARLRKQRQRSRGEGHAEVPPPSSSSSSSSSSSLRSEDSVCPDLPPEAAPAGPSPSPVLFRIPLVKKDGEYEVTQAQVDEWTGPEGYPGVDVLAELRRMVHWSKVNPGRRKTRRGVLKFINGWLEKEQDRGPRGAPRGQPPRPGPPDASSVYDHHLKPLGDDR